MGYRPLKTSRERRNILLTSDFPFICLAPTAPQNMQLNIQAPSLNVRPRMTVTWNKPASENGVIQKYTLVYTYTTERQAMSSQHNTDDGQTFSYSFDVLGGIQYSVTLRAETIKPGSKETKVEQVPVYSKLGFHVSAGSCCSLTEFL